MVPKAVIFDLDGVLVDSEPVWEIVRRRLVSEAGGRWLPDTQGRLMGMSTAEWAEYLSGELGLGAAAGLTPVEVASTVIARMEEAYARELPLLPGAVEAVRRIGQRFRIGLASSSPAPIIRTVLERSGLAGAFSATASSDEAPRGKPHPDVYLLAAQRLGVRAQDCVAIEDSTNGLRSAAAAGCRIIAIPRPAYPPAPDALAAAALVLDALSAISIAALDHLGPDAGPDAGADVPCPDPG
jgi:HAD superfamily hydrolase (TIGR01509 family)